MTVRCDKSRQLNGRQDPAAFRGLMCCTLKQKHKLEAESAGWMPLAEPGVQEVTAFDSNVASTNSCHSNKPSWYRASDLHAIDCRVLHQATWSQARRRRES